VFSRDEVVCLCAFFRAPLPGDVDKFRRAIRFWYNWYKDADAAKVFKLLDRGRMV
jgi:hypothetical protein